MFLPFPKARGNHFGVCRSADPQRLLEAHHPGFGGTAPATAHDTPLLGDPCRLTPLSVTSLPDLPAPPPSMSLQGGLSVLLVGSVVTWGRRGVKSIGVIRFLSPGCFLGGGCFLRCNILTVWKVV